MELKNEPVLLCNDRWSDDMIGFLILAMPDLYFWCSSCDSCLKQQK